MLQEVLLSLTTKVAKGTGECAAVKLYVVLEDVGNRSALPVYHPTLPALVRHLPVR